MTEETSITVQPRESLADESPGGVAVRRLLGEGDPVENTLSALAVLPGISCAAWVAHPSDGIPAIEGVYPMLLPGAPIPTWLNTACEPPTPECAGWVELPLPGSPNRLLHRLSISDAETWNSIAILIDGEPNADDTGFARAIAQVGLQTKASGVQAGESGGVSNELRNAMLLLATANQYDHPTAACRAICDEFASLWACDRATLGVLDADKARILSISHTEKLTTKATLIRLLTAAAEEAIDQNVLVVYPNNGSQPIIDRAAKDLASTKGATARVMACPIRIAGIPIGAVILERFAGSNFSTKEQRGVEIACELISRRTAELIERDRSVYTKLQLRARRTLARLVGPTHSWVKLFLILIGIFVLLSFVIQGNDHAAGTGNVLASEARTIAAPFSGFIESGRVRVGDQIQRDSTVIATLDTSQLELQLAQAQAERRTYSAEAAYHQDQSRAADAAVASARAQEVGARISLIEFQIASATVRSPIDGVVVEGDTTQLSGANITIGQQLAKVVQLGSMYIHLEIPESEMRGVEVGSRGQLLTPAYPSMPLELKVVDVSSIVVSKDTSRHLVAKALVDTPPDWLAPGMHGSVMIQTEQRPLLMVWTRRLSDWLRLQLWI